MASDIPAQLNIASWFVDRPAQLHPERIAIAGEPSAVTYGELCVLVNRVGNLLRSFGCSTGTRVLLVLPDSVEFVAAFFGVVKIGAVAIPINPFARTSDFLYYLADSAPQLAIVHSVALPRFLPALGDNPPRLIIVGGDSMSKNHTHWEDGVSAASTQLSAVATRAEDAALFLYTSGSTGIPKAAIHQHKSMVATSRNFGQGVLAIQPTDRTFSVSKLFFAYGLGNAMYFPLSAGASTVLNSERPSLDKVADMVKRFRPTLFFAVPTFYRAMLEEAAKGLQFDFSSVRLMVSAGESLSVSLFDAFHKRFGFPLLEGIGSTEMLQTFISNRPGSIRPGTCGFVVPGYQTKLVGDDGTPVPSDEIGMLHVRGESCLAGYWNKATPAAGTRIGDWVVTGDKFYCDADGYYHFCGRSDDLVKISGMWVLPMQVEAVLQEHPLVEKAVVLARQMDSGEKSLVAYVKTSQQALVEPKSLRHYLHERLPEHMIPRYCVVVPDFPLTANGKINRQGLPLPSSDVPATPTRDYHAPSTSTERELCGIWSAVLEIPKVGIEDDFVDLGGTSVTGMQCVSRIKKRFGIQLPLGVLLAESGTLKSVAAAIDEMRCCGAGQDGSAGSGINEAEITASERHSQT